MCTCWKVPVCSIGSRHWRDIVYGFKALWMDVTTEAMSFNSTQIIPTSVCFPMLHEKIYFSGGSRGKCCSMEGREFINWLYSVATWSMKIKMGVKLNTSKISLVNTQTVSTHHTKPQKSISARLTTLFILGVLQWTVASINPSCSKLCLVYTVFSRSYAQGL